jgi:RimJ/RimL family protein N-acetyltransferase
VTETLATPRLRLVPATAELVDRELASKESLATRLGVDLPHDWPPEHHDAEVLHFMRKALRDPSAAGWWLHYLVVTDGARPVLVGTAGYKGPPVAGVVEIGYSIVPSWRRRGLATEACEALVEAAWRRGAEAVVAHTLPELAPSRRVLEKVGFAPSEATEPGVLAFTLRREDLGPR